MVFIITLIGLLIYLLVNRPESAKIAEVGRIMFAFGLLVLMFGMDKITAIFGH